jgi:hypothetical protein
MRRTSMMVILLTTLAFARDTHKTHRDYVPDKKTAEQIAEAVLVAQFGEQQIKAQSPLLVDASNEDYWIVEVSGGEQNDLPRKGGGPAVWINKYSGCLKVMEHMK